jgi:hypothetical protein
MDQTESPGGTVDSHLLGLAALGDTDLNTIIESSLTVYFELGAVKSIVVDETHAGFEVHVTLTSRAAEGPFKLTTYRGERPRVWVSADRLIKYLKAFENVPPLVIRLLPREKKHGKNTPQPS